MQIDNVAGLRQFFTPATLDVTIPGNVYKPSRTMAIQMYISAWGQPRMAVFRGMCTRRKHISPIHCTYPTKGFAGDMAVRKFLQKVIHLGEVEISHDFCYICSGARNKIRKKTVMTQVVLNISNKKDLPLIRSLSKRMGWTMTHSETIEEPNETTLAAFREIESGAELETLDVDHFMDFVASL